MNQPSQTSRAGLATLAMLKTRFDQGLDHLGLFEPFVRDAIAQYPSESFVASDIAGAVSGSRGLQLPIDVVRTLLGRLARTGVVRSEGGLYLIVARPTDSVIDLEQQAAAQQQEALGAAFSSFAGRAGITLSPDDALVALATFISENKVSLLLNETVLDSPLESASLGRKTIRLVARFITEECLGSPLLKAALEGLTEGMVLQDTLLLRDVGSVSQRFRGLTVVLDSPILLAALDLTGLANTVAAREGLALLRDAGATTIAFDRTIDEIRRILLVYESRLGTAAGRLSLNPTELTHYVLTNRLAPSNIRTISATLERRLASIAIPVRELPKRDARFTLDEDALARGLRPDNQRRDDSSLTEQTVQRRIQHDVDCIAGVLSLRAGRTAHAVEKCSAIFCTTSGRVIRTVQQWYRQQAEYGVPPIVHQFALSSLAWIKKPASARGVKIHELAALCSAVLRPSEDTWGKFLGCLRDLRADGTLNDDEVIAVVASSLTEPLLTRLDDDHVPESDTIAEAIERVRESYREDMEATAEIVIRDAQGRVALAEAAARGAADRLTSVQAEAMRRADRVGEIVAAAFHYTAGAIVILAAMLSLPVTGTFAGATWQWTARTITAINIVLGAYSQLRGPSVKELRERVAGSVSRRTFAILYPGPPGTAEGLPVKE